MACRGTESQSRPDCDCSSAGWKKNFCSRIWCVQVAELSQAVELHHLHHPHLQTLRALQGSQRQPSHSAWSCTNSKNQNPIACCKQNHKRWIKLLTEIALKQVQKSNNQNRLVSCSVWKIQSPRFLCLHGKWMCSPALPDTAIQTELLICLTDSNPLPKDLRRPGLSHCVSKTHTADQQVLGHPSLKISVPIYTIS